MSAFLARFPRRLGTILTLCYVQAIGTTLLVHIFPFVTAFFLSMDVDKHDVGKWSGLAESLYSMSNFAFTSVWVYLIERVPKRFLLIESLFAAGLVAILFGLSTQIWQALLIRAVLGMIQALGLLANFVLGDIVDANGRAQAFAWIGSANYAGAALGSSLGGWLALPGGRIPVLGDLELFKRKGYALPGMALASGAWLGIALVLKWVPETGKRRRNDDASQTEITPLIVHAPAASEHDVTYKHLIQDKRFLHNLALNFVNKINFFGTLTLISIAAPLDPDIGGIGLSVAALGRLLAFTEICVVIIFLFLFPTLCKKASNRTMTVVSSLGWAMSAAFFVVANEVAQGGSDRWKISILGMWTVSRMMALLWWPLSQVLLVEIYPTGTGRTKAMGLQKQAASLASFVGSAMYGYLFAFSSRHQLGSVGRRIVNIVALVIALLSLILSCFQSQITPFVSKDFPDRTGEQED